MNPKVIHSVDNTVFAYQRPLMFDVPMLDRTAAPKTLEHVWRMIQFVFLLSPPQSAQRSPSVATPSQLAVIDRFVKKAGSLSRSQFLATPGEMTVSWTRDSDEVVDATFPDEEVERGFMTLLRQFVNPQEPASFKVAQAIAIDHANASGLNIDLLTSWGKVHRKLLRRPPKVWLDLKVAEGTEARVPNLHHLPIDRLFKAYFYGDIIHFGDGRDDLDRLSETVFDDASNRLTFHEGAIGLACYYMGYASLLQRIYEVGRA